MKNRTEWAIELLTFSILLLAVGCSVSDRDGEAAERMSQQLVEQMRYDGSEMCAFTGSTVETVRYGGRLELESGEIYTFMSVECMAGFYLRLTDRTKVVSLQAVDFTDGRRLLEVDRLVFLNSSLRPSPNGLYLTAIEASDKKMVTNIYDAYPGPLISWEEVLELVREEWDLTAVSAAEVKR